MYTKDSDECIFVLYDLLLLFTLQGLAAMWGDVFGAGGTPGMPYNPR